MRMGCVHSQERSEFLIRFALVLDTSVRPVGTHSEMEVGVVGGEGRCQDLVLHLTFGNPSSAQSRTVPFQVCTFLGGLANNLRFSKCTPEVLASRR